ncbi:hypothetical protein QBC46DRAFT_409844 [Diplogelasinospora grovesii]|uniref:DC-UbP/UBTD2 N-terminal domain-containing protein n=1 Tax=Diplogelasinospora grovesii TaxID=303347 RepID=A0AAN6N5X6_9PEZI|nr:hypothetical protein QBC46DRAFT_409844 [Diplogelasinospora grovesii]
MGCCISRPSGPNSPYPGGAGASGSARAINNASAPQTAGGTSSNTTGGGGGGGNDGPLPSPGSGSRRSARRRQGGTQSLTQHINKPLRRHEWSSRNNRVWTAAALARERAEFFDTRVAERQEIWQAIRAALEVLWAADAAAREGRRARARAQAQQEDTEEEGPSLGEEEDDPAIALATAQSILTAADITLPTGDLANGAYDALGNYYSIPEHVVSDPLNIARDSDGRDTGALADAKADLTAGEETADENDLDEVERRREEKGKAVVDVRDQIAVRLRLSDGSRDVNIAVGKEENVRSIARRAVDEAQLPSNKKIRIAYMGKILKETSPLLVQGWKQGHVQRCSPSACAAVAAVDDDEDDDDICPLTLQVYPVWSFSTVLSTIREVEDDLDENATLVGESSDDEEDDDDDDDSNDGSSSGGTTSAPPRSSRRRLLCTIINPFYYAAAPIRRGARRLRNRISSRRSSPSSSPRLSLPRRAYRSVLRLGSRRRHRRGRYSQAPESQLERQPSRTSVRTVVNRRRRNRRRSRRTTVWDILHGARVGYPIMLMAVA